MRLEARDPCRAAQARANQIEEAACRERHVMPFVGRTQNDPVFMIEPCCKKLYRRLLAHEVMAKTRVSREEKKL